MAQQVKGVPAVKVSVYKLEQGELAVLVQASPGKGRAPVLLQGITAENIVEKTLPVVVAMRKQKGEQIVLLTT